MEQFLLYKAQQYGCIVIKVDAHYTSQRCPKCGTIDKSARNHQLHEYHCKQCDFRTNDDRVAAMNLAELGRRYWPATKSRRLIQRSKRKQTGRAWPDLSSGRCQPSSDVTIA
ncbi:transposase [Schleiferilactobacillus harbinensis]|uniref:zinc ribbon domain-containing protein n=1 Tax=Schleiferilactobacillus harbinensis TaxID=304207 RepID=UPI001239F6D2|nr:zinc ribbon domain-containing protein [Schleiferilactobacillus harbinensis]QEU47392.1 transposase [Schleiferilactobacillus harbinensis]